MIDIQSFQQNPDTLTLREEGMTLRDYFAAKAMQGIMSCRSGGQLVNNDIAENISHMAYCIADAMLKARQS